MSPLLHAYLRLCLFRLAPQDLPPSRFLLQITLLGMLLSGILLLSLRSGFELVHLLAVLLDIGLSALLLYLALGYIRHPARLPQTLSALFGASTLIQLVTMPVVMAIGEGRDPTVVTQLALMLFMLLLGWSLAVVGHILRHALEIPLWVGVLLATTYWVGVGELITALGWIQGE